MQIVYTTQQSILYNKTVSHTHINAHKQTLPQMCRTNTRTHSRLCKQLCTYFHMQLVACVQVPPRFIFIVIPNPCSSVKDTFSWVQGLADLFNPVCANLTVCVSMLTGHRGRAMERAYSIWRPETEDAGQRTVTSLMSLCSVQSRGIPGKSSAMQHYSGERAPIALRCMLVKIFKYNSYVFQLQPQCTSYHRDAHARENATPVFQLETLPALNKQATMCETFIQQCVHFYNCAHCCFTY